MHKPRNHKHAPVRTVATKPPGRIKAPTLDFMFREDEEAEKLRKGFHRYYAQATLSAGELSDFPLLLSTAIDYFRRDLWRRFPSALWVRVGNRFFAEAKTNKGEASIDVTSWIVEYFNDHMAELRANPKFGFKNLREVGGWDYLG